ncbi:MAG: hypothetical protein DCF15_18805 [Phormidesmis priestleyi]|uniref:Uncharacterized protein n=1 Tax=Phormidesmis priestleyi TaxID=268141 RepID=A0A2W4WTK1_9CYAN|nr:MAG: hypothetical protein DCF15_18805 [Phormidesmis priestleyi]
MSHFSASLFCLLSLTIAQQPKRKAMAMALILGLFGALPLSGAPLLAQSLPSASSASSPISADSDAEIYSQVQEQWGTVRSLAQQGQVEAATARLNQSIALAKSIQSIDSRDRILHSIGLGWLNLSAGLEPVQAIAQAMTYETLGTTDQLRVELEKALIAAYVQADQIPQAIALVDPLPSGIRDQQAAYLIETLVQAGNLSAALPLAERFISAESYLRYQTSNSIIRAYIAHRTIQCCSGILQAQPFADPFDQARALEDIARWAGRAGQLETASATVDQIVADHRAPALVELARLYYYRGQPETAIDLLAAATQLPPNPSDAQSGWTATKLIAQAYAEFKQPTQAQQVLDDAANAPLDGDTYFPVSRIEAYLAIGAIDRATVLLNSLNDDGLKYEAMLRVAKTHSDQGRQAEAIALLNQIPDRALMPLPEYADPKVELLTQILDTTIENQPENGSFDLATQIAKSFENPATQVLSWVKIAAIYPENQRTAAIEALDQALVIARTIERDFVLIDRHLSYSKSNADLLEVVAEGYRSIGQADQAVATIREALMALQAFRSESPLALGGVREGEIDYGAIAQLAHDWQQQDFHEEAIGELEKQLAETESGTETSEIETFDTLSATNQILRLVRLTYDPNQAPSERPQHYLARLADLREQPTAPAEQIALLIGLIFVYQEIDQHPAIAEIAQQIIELTAQLPVEERDGSLTSLAFAISPIFASETEALLNLVKDLLSQISSPQSQVEGLRPIINEAVISNQTAVKDLLSQISSPQSQVIGLQLIINEAAISNQTALALAYFEDFLSLSEQSLSPSDRDNALVNLNNTFVFRTADTPTLPPATPAQVAILMRIPQYISDPGLRAFVAISIAPFLSPTESAPFYTALAETLAQQPNTYAKREMLWNSLNYAISLKYFDHAEHLATSLDDGYRQYALGWIETARQQP